MNKRTSPRLPQIGIHGFFVIIILSIIFLLSFSSILIMKHSLLSYRQSERISQLNEVSDYLFKSVTNYGFERGRVNVVLNDAGDPDGMEDNRQFIKAKRRGGDKALSNAIYILAPDHDKQPYIEKINLIKDEISSLRILTDLNMVIPLESRDPSLSEIWFNKMTEFIEEIESLLAIISDDISDADGRISRYSSIKLKVLSLRNTAGPEMSILSAAMLSEQPLKKHLVDKIQNLQVLSWNTFRELEYLVKPLTGSRVYQDFYELEKFYKDEYVIYRDEIYPLCLSGGPYPYSQTEFLSHGVDALKKIETFMDSVVNQTKDYTIDRINNDRNNILKHLFLLIGALFLVLVIFVLISYKIIKPMIKVTSKILLLGQGNKNVDIPYLDLRNEVGNMARAVNFYKDALFELDQNNRDLKNLLEERASLINELQAALDEVQDLRNIIPICSYCKKIRNDKGYYEALESYFSKHSNVDFSHTICPDCYKEYFPHYLKKDKDS